MRLIRKQTEGQWFEYPEAEGVRFKIRPFPASKLVFQSAFVDGKLSAAPNPAETLKAQFVHCVQDWQGIEDADGNPLACTAEARGMVADYGLLPAGVMDWVRECIQEMEDGKKADEGN